MAKHLLGGIRADKSSPPPLYSKDSLSLPFSWRTSKQIDTALLSNPLCLFMTYHGAVDSIISDGFTSFLAQNSQTHISAEFKFKFYCHYFLLGLRIIFMQILGKKYLRPMIQTLINQQNTPVLNKIPVFLEVFFFFFGKLGSLLWKVRNDNIRKETCQLFYLNEKLFKLENSSIPISFSLTSHILFTTHAS